MVKPVSRAADRDGTDPKIILIGFNKCATLTFHDLFEGSGIRSVHWRDEDERHIAQVMMTNIALGLPPLRGFGPARAFSDLSYGSRKEVIEGVRFFRELHAAYPDAYFILNTRPVEAWVESRRHHAGGSYLRRCATAGGIGEAEVVERWRALHAAHTAEVMQHFAGADRFLVFDISTDDPLRVADFLAPDFAIDLAHWGKANARNPSP